MPKPLPSPELLRKLLRYDPETGKLFWLARTPDVFPVTPGRSSDVKCKMWNTRWAGKEAFTADKGHGYKNGVIFCENYYAHRVIFAIVRGHWPRDCIDHINGDGADNRICNLRAATISENSRNQKLCSTNTSGVVGVTWNKAAGKWAPQIQDGGRNVWLGYFSSKSEAIAVRKAAEVEYGYHQNHGRTESERASDE